MPYVSAWSSGSAPFFNRSERVGPPDTPLPGSPHRPGFRHRGVCKSQPRTASKGGELQQRFRVTHPFHPLLNQELELVSYRQSWGEERVYYYGPAPGRAAVERGDSRGCVSGAARGGASSAAMSLSSRRWHGDNGTSRETHEGKGEREEQGPRAQRGQGLPWCRARSGFASRAEGERPPPRATVPGQALRHPCGEQGCGRASSPRALLPAAWTPKG